MTARARWKAYWRRLRIARREYGKAHRDMMIFGTGYVRIDDAGFINHILPEAIIIDGRTEGRGTMSESKDGGPAFPIAPEPGIMAGCDGMMLRDYFAAQAVGAALTRAIAMTRESGTMSAEKVPMFVATLAYDVADAMLKERSK